MNKTLKEKITEEVICAVKVYTEEFKNSKEKSINESVKCILQAFEQVIRENEPEYPGNDKEDVLRKIGAQDYKSSLLEALK